MNLVLDSIYFKMRLVIPLLFWFLMTGFSNAQSFPEFLVDSSGNGYFSYKNDIWSADRSGKKVLILKNRTTRFLAIDPNGTLIGSTDSVSIGTGTKEIYIWKLYRNGQLEYTYKIPSLPDYTDFCMDEEGHLYWITSGNQIRFQERNNNGTTRTLATCNLTGARNLHRSIKGFLFFSDNNHVYCIPPEDSIKVVMKDVVKRLPGESTDKSIRNVWTDKSGNIYLATGIEIFKIDRRQYTTPVYRSTDGWFPVNGAISSSGDFWVVEQNRYDSIRIQFIGNDVRKGIVKEQRLKLYGLPLGLTILMVVGMYFLFRKSKNSKSRSE